MNKDVAVAFRTKLVNLCKEYGIKHASIAGTWHDEFVGWLLIDDDDQSPGGMFEAITNVGRLWQHSRTSVRAVLNDFEK